MCEIHAIVRAHVAALGGNALISYFLSEFVVMHNPHKNQAQCLIHVGGDSVQVTYFHQVSNLGLHASSFLRISNKYHFNFYKFGRQRKICRRNMLVTQQWSITNPLGCLEMLMKMMQCS